MHALSRSLRTIRVSPDGLRALLERVAAAVPSDARVRLLRIGGVRQNNVAVELASVDELTALPRLPDVLYDLSLGIVAAADRGTKRIEYRLQLVSDASGLSLQVFSDDAPWAHGALQLLGDELAEFEVEPSVAEAPPGPLARLWKPLLAGALAGAAIATAYYRDAWAGAALAGLGAALWYLIDLIFAVAAPPPTGPRELPNLAVVVRDVAAFAPERRRTGIVLQAVKAVAALVAVAVVAGLMLRFFPHQAPASHASARHERRR
jgi:hypothetical protein